jgi:sulfatase modifying factor 1
VPGVLAPGPARVVIEPWTGMALAVIAPGSFTMGSPSAQPGRNPDELQRTITISRSFYLGIREVTQAEWAIVMGANPSHFEKCSNCPVESINFYDVDRFLANLNARSTALQFRLPSEAEWEYACRAGTSGPTMIEPEPTADQANTDGSPGSRTSQAARVRGSTVPVGRYPANAWGLFDMQGNVWEWTNDWYGEYSPRDIRDPRGPSAGTRRVIRGGSWYFDANSARCGLRYSHAPQDSGFSLGFRVAGDPIQRQP